MLTALKAEKFLFSERKAEQMKRKTPRGNVNP